MLNKYSHVYRRSRFFKLDRISKLRCYNARSRENVNKRDHNYYSEINVALEEDVLDDESIQIRDMRLEISADELSSDEKHLNYYCDKNYFTW